MTLEQITEKLNALTAQAETALASVQGVGATAEQVEEVKSLIGELQPQVATLTSAREEAIREEEYKSMKSELTTLHGVLEELRKPAAGFSLGTGETKSVDDDDPYTKAGVSVYNDIRMANRGVQAARDRLVHGISGKALLNDEGKAMTEGTQAQGGYLVRPQVERQIVLARELDNVMRGLCSTLNVNTNSIQLDQLALSTTAGWVAELAQKPESTGMTLATVSASVFTAAGLATISNQLLADSDPSVDALVTADLAKRLVALEEIAMLAGTGTGQPLGILNTPGIGATTLTSTTVADLLDAILDALAGVETAFGAPSAILMHPRTWTRILKSKDAQGLYLVDPTGGVQDPRTGVRGPVKSLWGYPVLTTNRMPINLGGTTNESRVIIGDFKEALILDRQGITVDESPHVYFTTNQTVFRAEFRMGFTAARTPVAFNVIGGAGLAAG